MTPRPTLAAFTDVAINNTFAGYIDFMAARHVISGYGDGTFGVDKALTRGQLAKLIALASNSNLTIDPAQQTFADVPYNSPFWPYVEALSRDKIFAGYADGAFQPDATATRGQVALIIARALKLEDAVPAGQQTFNDVPVGSLYYTAIEQLAAKGVISGSLVDGALVFRPLDNVTRGQATKVLTLGFFPGYRGQ